MMEQELLENGFPREQLEMIPDEQAAIAAALESGRRGDLLILFADKISRSWKQVIYFKPSGEDKPGTFPPPAGEPVAPPSLVSSGAPSSGEGSASSDLIVDGALVIQDERGVRLAREQDD